MEFKLAIADKIGVKVKGTLTTETGADRPFEFVLVCNRKSNDEMKAVLSDKDKTAQDFFAAEATGWRGQGLVLTADDKPADFSSEALQQLLNISGMAALCWHSYVQQVGATAKN
jgi:hypothetical protein